MKRKTGILLTGGVLALAMTAGSVQAKTIGYDLGNGSSMYYFVGDGANEQNQTEGEALADADAGSFLTEDESRKLEAWYKVSMQEAIAYVEKYGVSYDAENDCLLYNGQKVRWLIDEQIDGNIQAIHMPEGEIDLYTTRSENYELTGIRVASQQEYDERTRQDELDQKQAYGSGEMVAEDGEDAAYDSFTMYGEPEGGILYTWTEDAAPVPDDAYAGNAVSVPDDGYAEEKTSVQDDGYAGDAVPVPDDGYAGDAVLAQDDKYAEEKTSVQDGGHEAAADVVSEGAAGSWADTEEEKKKTAEYAEVGITKSNHGGWLWNGKAIYFLLDEDGGLHVNNTSETKKEKIYVLVKRNEDGSIKEAKQVTDEEVLRAKMKMDE